MTISKDDIKELTIEELLQKIDDIKKMHCKIRFNHTVSPLDHPVSLRFLRKDIARLMSEYERRRQLALISDVQI